MTGTAALLVYAGLLALLAVGVIVRPPTALSAVNCIYGLKQWGQSTNGWLAAHPPATNLAIGVLVLCAIVTAAARGRCVLCKIPTVTWLIVVLLLYSLLSLEWTPRLDLALPIWRDAYPYLLTFIVLVPLVLHDAEDFRIALSWLVVVGGLLVLVLLVFGHWGLRGLALLGQSAEEETNPLALAGLGGSVATAAMLLRPRWKGALSWILRLAVVGASLLLIIRSESRGQLLAVVAAMILMLPFAVRMASMRGMVLAVISCAVIGGALEFGFSHLIARQDADRFSQSTSSADVAVRASMVEKLLEAWGRGGDTMLLGLGNSASWDPNINGIYPHNVPMEVLGEEGLVGFLLYVTIFVYALTSLLQAIRESAADPDKRSTVAALGSSFLFFAMITFKQGNMLGSVEFFLYAILVVRLAHAVKQARSGDVAAPQEAEQVSLPLFPNMMR